MSTGFNVDDRTRALVSEPITIGGVEYTRRLRTVELDDAVRAKTLDFVDAVQAEDNELNKTTVDRAKAKKLGEKVRELDYQIVAMLLQGPKGAEVDPKVLRAAVDTRILPELKRHLDRPAPDPS